MNEFLETLGAVAKKAAGAAATQLSITQEEQKIRQACLKLGKLYISRVHNGGQLTGESFDRLVAEVDAAAERIRRIKMEKKSISVDFETIED